MEHSNRILCLELLCEQSLLQKQRDFYALTLRLPVIAESSDSFEILAGATSIRFTVAIMQKSPFYHLAFNIPENKIQSAIDWSVGKLQLLKNEQGETVINFPRWDAHSIYFYDPVGNILEFIAHHSLKNNALGVFSEKDMLCVCEIGLVSQNVQALAKEIKEKIGLNDFIIADSLLNSNTFRALGDAKGMLILSQQDRKWLMTDMPATDYPLRLGLSLGIGEEISLDNCSCVIDF